MRDLEAAGNPYAGKYSDFDRWAFAHFTIVDSRRVQRLVSSAKSPGFYVYWVACDSDGYVVPVELQLEWDLNPPADYQESPCQYNFLAAGDMDPKCRDWLEQSALKNLAQGVPPIPQWLADDPPCWVAPVASGEYLTLGQLGSGRELQRMLTWRMAWQTPYRDDRGGGLKYCRYDASGNLVSEAENNNDWWRMFFTEFDTVVAELSQGKPYWVREYNGTVVIYEQTSWTPLGTYDFQGNPIDTGDEKYGAQNLLNWIYGGNLRAVYEKQQEASADTDATLAVAMCS